MKETRHISYNNKQGWKTIKAKGIKDGISKQGHGGNMDRKLHHKIVTAWK